MKGNLKGEPLSGLKKPDGEITTGSRPKRTLRVRNAKIACAFELKGKRVLDLGCAEGLHSLYMAESAMEVTGIDHRQTVINRAEANKINLGISNVTFKCGDIRDPSLFNENDKFDLVVAWGFLHRITDIFSFIQRLSPITNALSLEWRTPVLPFMSRLNFAYHSPFGDNLDPMNLGDINSRPGEESSDSDKIEGPTGFWEPTPGAMKSICRQFGFSNDTNLGYGDLLISEFRFILGTYRRRLFRQFKGNQQFPLGRVHVLYEKDKGSIKMKTPFSKDVHVPEWDDEMQNILNKV